MDLLRKNDIEPAARRIEEIDRVLGVVIQRQFTEIEQAIRFSRITREQANVEKNTLTVQLLERLIEEVG